MSQLPAVVVCAVHDIPVRVGDLCSKCHPNHVVDCSTDPKLLHTCYVHGKIWQEGGHCPDCIGKQIGELDHIVEERLTFEDFAEQVRDLVESRAKEKGYNETGAAGRNPLFEFTNQFFPGHSQGEVVYKLVRYEAKRNREDLLKAAAWIYLLWKYDGRVKK